VALGDSYSSGVGAGDYDPDSGDCKRSANAYPQLWSAANAPSSFDFVACSGATTDDVLSGQLDALSDATGVVSISIGGNDVGFADTMT
ncbi:lipase, partial [Streptomyces daliensis]|nr:lipase [Streptomyces daliensis]